MHKVINSLFYLFNSLVSEKPESNMLPLPLIWIPVAFEYVPAGQGAHIVAPSATAYKRETEF